METKWLHPWTAIVSGPSGAGKTVFIQKFLHNLPFLTDTVFERIVIYYTEWQNAYKQLRCKDIAVEFREGLPQSDDFRDARRPKLVILDDLMHESSSGDQSIVHLFTRGSHHRNLSVFFLTQNLFHQGRGQRDISLNAGYIVIFKNPRDRAQIQHLARQVCPENPLFLREAYRDATNRAHGYLVIDLKQETPEEFRFRANIFPDSHLPPVVYVPKKSSNAEMQKVSRAKKRSGFLARLVFT